MAAVINEHVGRYDPSRGVLPESLTVEPWDKNGAAAVVINAVDHLVLDDNSVVAVLNYERTASSVDAKTSSPPRQDDTIEISAFVTVQQSDAWAPDSTAAVCGMVISDGRKQMAVTFGIGEMWFVDPQLGLILKSIGNFDTSRERFVHFRKVGAARWEVEVDGKVVGSLPYLLAQDDAAGFAAYVKFGSLSAGHTSESHWRLVEDSLNRPLARLAGPPTPDALLPGPVVRRLTAFGSGLRAAALALLEGPRRLLIEAAASLTADRNLVDDAFFFVGDQLPTLEAPSWTLIDSGNISVLRERLRLDSPTGAETAIRASFPPFLANAIEIPMDNDIEHRASAWFEVLEYVADANGRVGPFLRIRDNNRIITAQLVEGGVATTGAHGWVLTGAATVGAITLKTTLGPHLVNIHKRHRVEIQVLGRDVVLLMVDDAIVDWVEYGDFTDATTDELADIGANGSGGTAGADCDVLISDGLAQRRGADLTRRGAFLQDILDRLIFHGGCERNDELESWKRRRFDIMKARGTERGMIVEMRRLTCDDNQFVVLDVVPAEWYLEVSYPEFTPIWLEVGGSIVTTAVEFTVVPPNFTLLTFADLLARYLVPAGTLDLKYEICVATVTTGAVTSTPGVDRLPVGSSEHFTVGDIVTVRNAANTASEQTVVVAIPSAVLVDVYSLSAGPTFPSGSVLRRVITTT